MRLRSILALLALPAFIHTACSSHDDDVLLGTVCGGYVDPKATEVAVRRLLAAGADPDAKGNTKECGGVGARPLHVALIFDRELVPLLLAAGANPNSRTSTSQTPLHYAALRGDLHSCELLVAAGGDVNAVDRDGTSVLAIALARSECCTHALTSMKHDARHS